MNAVFFGIKQEAGIESEAGVKELPVCSTAAAGTLPTRKHVLQVSTYQVIAQEVKLFHQLTIAILLDVRSDAFQQSRANDLRGNSDRNRHPRKRPHSCPAVAFDGQITTALALANTQNEGN